MAYMYGVTIEGEQIPVQDAVAQMAIGGPVEELVCPASHNGYYIDTSEDTVNVSTPASSTNLTYEVYDCAEGDVFTIAGNSPASKAGWFVIIAANGAKLYSSPPNASFFKTVVAPAGASKVILNRSKFTTGTGNGRKNKYYRNLVISTVGDNLQSSIAPKESSIAVSNHAQGDLIVLNGRLLKTKSAIVTGDVLNGASGGNMDFTTVAEELAALEARIAALEGSGT